MHNKIPYTYFIPKWGVPISHIRQQSYQAEAEALCNREGTWKMWRHKPDHQKQNTKLHMLAIQFSIHTVCQWTSLKLLLSHGVLIKQILAQHFCWDRSLLFLSKIIQFNKLNCFLSQCTLWDYRSCWHDKFDFLFST